MTKSANLMQLNNKVQPCNYINKKFVLWIYLLIYLGIIALFIYYGGYVAYREYQHEIKEFSEEHPISTLVYSIILYAICFISMFFAIILVWKTYYMLMNLFISFFFEHKLVSEQYKLIEQAVMPSALPTVALCVTVKNDFSRHIMDQNILQTYKKCLFYILDDSTQQPMINKIDEYVKTHPIVKLIRRPKDISFGLEHEFSLVTSKNYFIKNTFKDWDYVTWLQADVIIPEKFVEKNIKLFYCGINNLGVVSSILCSRRHGTFFQNIIRFNSTNIRKNMLDVWQSKMGVINCCDAGIIFSKQALASLDYVWSSDILDYNGQTADLIKKDYKVIFSCLEAPNELAPLYFRDYKHRYGKWKLGELQLIKEGKYSYKAKNVGLAASIVYRLNAAYLIMSPIIHIWMVLTPIMFYCLMYKAESSFFYLSLELLPVIYVFIKYLLHMFFRKNFFVCILSMLFEIIFSLCFVWYDLRLFFTFITRKKIKYVVTPKHKVRSKHSHFWANRISILIALLSIGIGTVLYLYVLKRYSEHYDDPFILFSFFNTYIPSFFIPFIMIALANLSHVFLSLISAIGSNKKDLTSDNIFDWRHEFIHYNYHHFNHDEHHETHQQQHK